MKKSKLHLRVELLLKDLLGQTRILNEVRVSKLFSDYPSNREKYDIVIPSYRLVVECHGQQHKFPSTFGGDPKEAERLFTLQKYRDRKKEEVVWRNGWGYIVIWYNDLPKKDKEALQIIKDRMLEAIERIEDI